jgi:hypothetical protein
MGTIREERLASHFQHPAACCHTSVSAGNQKLIFIGSV